MIILSDRRKPCVSQHHLILFIHLSRISPFPNVFIVVYIFPLLHEAHKDKISLRQVCSLSDTGIALME